MEYTAYCLSSLRLRREKLPLFEMPETKEREIYYCSRCPRLKRQEYTTVEAA